MDEILHIKNLSKCYGDTKVLKNINISVKKGEVVVIIGPSGCGKSTLLRCLNGLEEIQEGEVLLDDQVVNPNKKNLSKNREKIGMVFQSYDLFPHLTILQNVTLAPIKVKKRNRREVEKEALELLERVGLRSKKDDYPRQLSGGQKQRVAIVRALIMHPEVLLLDEITAALDPEMVREVLDVVLDLAKEGRTMVIVTHEMQFAKAVADRVTFLEGGKIVEEGEPKKLFEKPETDRLQRFLQTFTYEKAVK
nr:amino acid ABC transporter ATP-binding protein [Mediterraneibacter faecis]